MVEQDPAAAERFARTRQRHRFTARRVTVIDVVEVERFTRVTLSSGELGDWASTGPDDHAKVFFPDPETGELVAPAAAGPDIDGIVRPERPAFGRDFTPLNVRESPSGHRIFDIDILRHDDAGPAAAWAARAVPGDDLVVVGPRGSAAAATEAPRVLCVVDGTALPAAARWIAEMPAGATVEVIADVAEPLDWVRSYLAAEGGRNVTVTAAGPEYDGLAEAARAAGIDAGTFVFAGGEAGRLVPLRRLLKHELGLPREQYSISGYWKRGDASFDHHAPIDPDDPED